MKTKPAADPNPAATLKLADDPAQDNARDPRELARERARECGAELEAVLAKHRCRIVPFLNSPEPVGNDGSKAIVSASFGIFPLDV